MPQLFIHDDSDDEQLQLELSRQAEEAVELNKESEQSQEDESPGVERTPVEPSQPLYPLIPEGNLGDDGLKPNLDDIRQVDIQLNLPLTFQQQVVENTLITDDPLVILGKGIGIISIVANLLFTLATPTRINGQPKRSFVIVMLSLIHI